MAAARHSAWTGVVILMLLLPVWTAWGPKVSWRILPAATGSGGNSDRGSNSEH